MKKLWMLLLLVFSYQLVEAQVRTYSNEFLALGVGARALAMGNSQVGSVNDVTSAYWNPSGLVELDNFQLGIMHAEWFAGISKYDYAGLAFPIDNNTRTVGLSLIRFGVDDIPNTLNIVEPDGSINYDNITTFSAADYAALFSYAQRWRKFNIGGNVKIIHRKVGDFANAWGFGLDVGAQYVLNEHFKFGATIKDLTTTFNAWSFSFTEDEKEILAITDNVIPSNSVEQTGQRLILGGAYSKVFTDKLSLVANLDFDVTFDGKRNVLLKTSFASIDPHIGAELNYNNFLFLRAGLNNIQRFTADNDPDKTVFSIQPNAGIGLKVKKIHIDYAFTGLNNVSRGTFSHVFSVKIDFIKPGSRPSISTNI